MINEKCGYQTAGMIDENQNIVSTQTLEVHAEPDNRNILLDAENHLQKIFQNIERHKLLLESGKLEREKIRKESKKHIVECANLREKFSTVNKKISTKISSLCEVAQIAQPEFHETLVKLAEKQKAELEDLYKRIARLQSQLEAKQGLDLEFETLKSFEADHVELQGKRKIYQEMKEEVESLATVLMVNEQKVEGELHEALGALIDGFKEFSSPKVGAKKMGELNASSFLEACKRRYPIEIAEVKAVELCSLWEANLQDHDWNPLKTIFSDGGCKDIDMEDERLKTLKEEWGEEVHIAVTSAMTERNEYNSKERLPVTVLWNFELDRKASLGEGTEVLLQKWRTLKRRKVMALTLD